MYDFDNESKQNIQAIYYIVSAFYQGGGRRSRRARET